MAQGDEPNAKDDTRFYSTTSAGLEVDLSQLADDISVGTNSFFESGAQARWDVSHPAAWELDVTMNDTDTGYLFTYESGGSGARLQLTTGGVIDAYVDGSSVAQVTVPDIDAGGDNVIISWSTEANPYTTGAGNAVRSELRVFNVDDGSFDQDIVTHAAITSVSATAIWLARSTGGSLAFSGTANELRFSAGRFHPAAEAREDFVANTSAPTLTMETRREINVPTRDAGTGDDNQFAGPIYMSTAAGIEQADLRQASHIWAERYRDQPDLDETIQTNRALAVPDDTDFTFAGQYLLHRPVSKSVNRLLVRVHVQSFRTDIATPDNVLIRCYSMNRPSSGIEGFVGPVPVWTRFFREITVNADDGSGTTGGAWYTFDHIEIARDENDDGTWVALAFEVEDDGGGGTEDQRWRIRAWTGEPGVEDVPGGLPLAGGLG